MMIRVTAEIAEIGAKRKASMRYSATRRVTCIMVVIFAMVEGFL